MASYYFIGQSLQSAGTFTGAVSVGGGLTVTSGGAAITGNSTVTGTLTTTSSHNVQTANGALGTIQCVSGTATGMSGATATISNLIPAGSVVLGVCLRVTTLIASGDGGTSFTIGDGTTANAFGSGIAFTAGTTTNNSAWTKTSAPVYASATSLVLTCTGGTFSAGAVRATVFYASCTAPTS